MTLTPYDRDFMHLAGIAVEDQPQADQEPEGWNGDNSDELGTCVGIRNALVLSAVVVIVASALYLLFRFLK